MRIIDYIKGVFNKMFSKDDIKKALGITVAISNDMVRAIEQWNNMYRGNASWIDKNVSSLLLEQGITREFANVSLNEMVIKVTNDKLNTVINNSVKDLNEHLQKALALGSMIIKPLGVDSVQYVHANSFIPVEYDSSGMLTKVVFPEVKKVGSNYYTRLEYHCLDDNGLTITNKAFKSNSASILGREISLDTVEEWGNLETSVSYPLMTRPAYGYYRNPIDNTIDNSPCGVSIFNSAIELIKKTDTQFARLDWEFESGERAIHVDETALIHSKANGKVVRLGKLNDRLYKGLTLDGGKGELFKEFSPQFREQNIIAGLEEYKRNIEFTVGLSYGDISNPQTIEKTATEIKSAKKRKYNTVMAIQNNVRDCLDGALYAFAFYNGLATSNYKFVCDFKDSILTDDETERKQDIQDLAIGIITRAEYRAKWYGETIEQAEKNLPIDADVIE